MNEYSENAQFARLIVALEPWLTQVVIIGGWAHRLYRLHPSAQHIEYLPLTTLDTDIAVPPRLKVIDKDVRERLIANGFEEERLGQDQPPATHYRLRDAKSLALLGEHVAPPDRSVYEFSFIISSQCQRTATFRNVGEWRRAIRSPV
jgi:hypothetical protein